MASSLYLPVKRFLERLGFEAKGEICGCNLVALRDGEPPAVIIGSFNGREIFMNTWPECYGQLATMMKERGVKPDGVQSILLGGQSAWARGQPLPFARPSGDERRAG